jgi:hypothetical protein
MVKFRIVEHALRMSQNVMVRSMAGIKVIVLVTVMAMILIPKYIDER